MPILLTPTQPAGESGKFRVMHAGADRDFNGIEISMLLMAPG
jgi:hypothetical protein